MRKPTFKVYTLGCKVNQYDSGDLSRRLIAAGFRLVKKNARIAIINTCCVTKTAIHKCKRMINGARRENPRAKVVVAGCWPKVYQEEAKELGADMIRGVGKRGELIREIFNIQYSTFQPKADQLRADNQYPISNIQPLNQKEINDMDQYKKARYFIKIQDGCEQFCSYCIIPYTRGKLKSREEKEVIAEVKQSVNVGYKEVVLSGIHLGLYRREVKSKKFPPKADQPLAEKVESNLVRLLNKIIKIKGLGRIGLSSIEVTEVGDELIELIAASKKLCRHLHIPLQSGSNKILKLMNRSYDVKYYKSIIKKIRKLMPDIAVTTDVIVGFPGETRKDFNETCRFIKEARFSRLHVFPFSEHKKTPAASMPGKVKKEEIERRAKKLRELGKKLEENFRRKFVGKELDVVIECKKGRRYKGKTEYYFDVELDEQDITGGAK